jgi:membrane protease YdiL (CAAX protease family)
MGGLQNNPYFKATRHPWACLVFILPLLAAYEGGVLWLGSAQPETLRNGADTWMRWALEGVGLTQMYWAPALLAVFLAGWSWLRRGDRPKDGLSLWIGMTIESGAFALGLWGISKGLVPLLDRLGIKLAAGADVDPVFAQVVSFLGAGIYEEVLFRLLLFSGLVWAMCYVEVDRTLALTVAALASATLFSTAHHLGPNGEPFDGYIFLFRTLAGLYFTVIYQLRGFGIAVGAHAFYDVLVGVLVPSAAGSG